MNLSELNYLAITVAGLVYFFLGFAWYSQILFGKIWMKLMKITPEQLAEGKKKNMTGPILISIIKALVIALVLTFIVLNITPISLVNGLLLTFFLWLAFILATNLDRVLWENSPLGLFWLNSLYHLTGFIIIILISSLWR